MSTGPDKPPIDDFWQTYLKAFARLDSSILAFANENSMEVIKNYHERPNRLIKWTRREVEFMIQLWADNDPGVNVGATLFGSRSVGGQEYWHHIECLRHASLSHLVATLPNLLAEWKKELESWNPAEFHLATVSESKTNKDCREI